MASNWKFPDDPSALNKGAASAADAWVNGYLDPFGSWSYARDAFDKWAADCARRFSELRATKS